MANNRHLKLTCIFIQLLLCFSTITTLTLISFSSSISPRMLRCSQLVSIPWDATSSSSTTTSLSTPPILCRSTLTEDESGKVCFKIRSLPAACASQQNKSHFCENIFNKYEWICSLGHANATFCPHAFGCRNVLVSENQIILDVTDHEVYLTVQIPAGKTLWLVRFTTSFLILWNLLWPVLAFILKSPLHHHYIYTKIFFHTTVSPVVLLPLMSYEVTVNPWWWYLSLCTHYGLYSNAVPQVFAGKSVQYFMECAMCSQDYVLVVPQSSYSSSYLNEEPLDKSYDFISSCGQNSFHIKSVAQQEKKLVMCPWLYMN